MMNMKRFLVIASFASLAAILYSLAMPTTQGRDKVITFTKDVAPILFKNCAQCHRPDDIAPFSVLSYKDVRPWAKSIREKVISREMPPWHADPKYGNFSNDMRLTEAEIETITGWVDGGAKEGDPREMPPAPILSSTWEIGQPDLVLTMPEMFEIPAGKADDYIYFRVPTNFTEDKWVEAAEFRPGNKSVVHHAVVFLETPSLFAMAQDLAKKGGVDSKNPISVFQMNDSGTMYLDGTVNRTRADAPVINDACAAQKSSKGGGGAAILAAYAPGRNADIYPKGTAKRLQAGSNLIFQMHYAKNTGKPEKDRTSIALVFAKQPVERMVETLLIFNDLFAIPPGADNHEATACHTLRRDIQLINYMPHMHVRGKDMKYEVVYPDGKRETLISVAPYSFNWQTLYKLRQPVAIPRGSRLMVTGHFDNSAKNRLNPDPTKTVRFGEPTYDEMLVGFIDYTREKPIERVIAKVDPGIYDLYAGEYTAGPGPKFTIKREGNKLLFIIPGQPALEALPESETRFFFRDFEGAQVTFIKSGQNEVSGIQAEFGQQKINAKKVK